MPLRFTAWLPAYLRSITSEILHKSLLRVDPIIVDAKLFRDDSSHLQRTFAINAWRATSDEFVLGDGWPFLLGRNVGPRTPH